MELLLDEMLDDLSANKKPMKEIDVYRLVRRDPVSGVTPCHTIDSTNSKTGRATSYLRGMCAFVITLKLTVNNEASVH